MKINPLIIVVNFIFCFVCVIIICITVYTNKFDTDKKYETFHNVYYDGEGNHITKIDTAMLQLLFDNYYIYMTKKDSVKLSEYMYNNIFNK